MKKRIFIYILLFAVSFCQGCLTEANMAPVGVNHSNITNAESFGYTSNTTVAANLQEKEELIRIILLVGIVLLLLLILILRFQHTFIEDFNRSDSKK